MPYLGCSVQFAGGGSEGEAKVIGAVIGTDNKPAPNTQVQLIPEHYNPLRDPAISDSCIDTTDDRGVFEFTVSRPGVYNVQAVQFSSRTKALCRGVVVGDQPDTIVLPADTLKNTGTVKIFLPDTTDTINGYMYIEGTTMYKRLSGAFSDSRDLSIIIDSVFAAIIPPIYFDRINNPSCPVLLSAPVEVLSNDTTVIDPVVVNWIQYTADNSDLPENHLREIHICLNGFSWLPATPTLWFSTYISGVTVFDKSTWKTYDTATTEIPSNLPNQILGYDNVLWVASFDGLIKYDGYTWNIWNTQNGLPSDNVTSIAFTGTGDIWAGMRNGIGFFDKETELWTIYDTKTTGLSDHSVSSVTIDKNGNPWFATNSGVGTFNGVSWKVYTPNDTVTSVAADSNNHLWFGHIDGVSRYDGSLWFFYNYGTSAILQGCTYSIVPDKNNNIWICTETGLTMYDGTTWHDFNSGQYSFLKDKIIHDIAFDNQGVAWLCTKLDGVIAFRPKIK